MNLKFCLSVLIAVAITLTASLFSNLKSPGISASAQLAALPGPTNFTVENVGPGIISLNWKDNTATELGFVVWRWDEINGWILSGVPLKNSTSLVDYYAYPGLIYYYYLAGYDTLQYSEWAYGYATSAGSVKTGTPVAISVLPVEVEVGKTRQLYGYLKNQDGTFLESTPQIAWQVKDANAGSVNATGLLTAGKLAGTYEVGIEAKTSGLTTTSSVMLLPGPLAQVAIAPQNVNLGKGKQQQFVAVGADQYGNKIRGVPLTWESQSGSGSITQAGLFTAGETVGEYKNTVKVTASQGGTTRSALTSVFIEEDRLMYSSTRLDGQVQLYKVNLDGTFNTRMVDFSSSISVPATSWSPDGRRVIYEDCDTGCALVTMNDDGSWRIPLIGGTTPSWSPDGKKIAISRISGTTAAAQQAAGASELYVMDVDGGNLKRLTNQTGVELYPSWSPDGKRIAFELYKDSVSQIYVIDVDGSNQKNISSPSGAAATRQTSGEAPSWSPDGKEILFESNRESSYAIYVMNIDGSSVRRLTPATYHSICANWSIDGKAIAFASQNGSSNYEIYKADRFGNNMTKLSTTNSHIQINRLVHHVCPRIAPRKGGIRVSEESIIIKNVGPAKTFSQATLAAKVSQSVVRIETTLESGKGVGSGFVVGDGLVMTNNHVVSDGTKIEVKLSDGKVLTATIQKRDPIRDLALLKIDAKNLVPIQIGDDGWLEKGTEVALFGFPEGVQELVVTTGYVTDLISNLSIGVTYVTTDSKSRPGNSGGPLVTLSGHVAGMLTLGRTGIATIESGSTISSSTIRDFLNTP